MNRYAIGTAPTVEALFTDEDGGAADPTTVTLSVTKPDATVVVFNTGSLSNPAVGRWEKAISVDQLGTWTYEFVGSGNVDATSTGELRVENAPVRTGATCDPWVTPVDLACTVADADVAQWACDFASDTLYAFSGRVFTGLCTDTVRPRARRPFDDPGPVPILGHSRIYSWGPWSWLPAWGSCDCVGGSFGLGGLDEVRLGSEPVVSVDQVLIDGAVLDPASYRVDDGRFLVRLDGLAWPCCQDLAKEPTEVGTWEVVYTYGREIPPVAQRQGAILACELAKAASGDSGCALPRRVTNVVRQGVTYTILDPLSVFAEGRTGISEVDLWLASVNPHKTKVPARVWSPQRVRRVRHPGGQ